LEEVQIGTRYKEEVKTNGEEEVQIGGSSNKSIEFNCSETWGRLLGQYIS
jgi:hypothetical protein